MVDSNVTSNYRLNMHHVHQLVPLKVIQEDYTIYWCRDCGLVCEKIAGKIYEMIPQWSQSRLLDEDTPEYKFLLECDSRPKPTVRRLGRGLKDIQTITPRNLLNVKPR